MNAKELNDAFIEACEHCPQFRGFDEEETELVNGRDVNVALLYKKGSVAVLRYWSDKGTIGGSLIHNSGYSETLPPYVLELLDRLDSVIETAIAEALAA